MMTTKMKHCILEYTEEIRKVFGVTLEVQFEIHLYNTSFNNQPECDKTDILERRINGWMMLVHSGGPIPNDVYD